MSTFKDLKNEGFDPGKKDHIEYLKREVQNDYFILFENDS